MPTSTEIIQSVCFTYGVSHAELVGERRTMRISEARQAACLLLRRNLRMSLVDVAAIVGRKDHSTVIYGVRMATNRIAKYPASARLFYTAEANLACADRRRLLASLPVT